MRLECIPPLAERRRCVGCWLYFLRCEREDGFPHAKIGRGARLALRTLLGEFPLLVVFCSFTQSKVPDATIATRLQLDGDDVTKSKDLQRVYAPKTEIDTACESPGLQVLFLSTVARRS